MGFKRAQWHSGLTYQRTCDQCKTVLQYTDYSLDFRPWYADGFVYCPRCKTPLRHNENYAINAPEPAQPVTIPVPTPEPAPAPMPEPAPVPEAAPAAEVPAYMVTPSEQPHSAPAVPATQAAPEAVVDAPAYTVLPTEQPHAARPMPEAEIPAYMVTPSEQPHSAPAVPAAQAAPAPAPAGRPAFCTKCGNKYGENDRFCSQCGNKRG